MWPSTPDEARAEEMVSTLIEAGLTEAESVMLERSESEPSSSDDEKASFWPETVALGSNSVMEALAHLSWLRACTRSMVITPRFQRLEYALASRLLDDSLAPYQA